MVPAAPLQRVAVSVTSSDVSAVAPGDYTAYQGGTFNLVGVAALLTLVGYSVNDTVVVSDRIRENLRKFKKMNWLGKSRRCWRRHQRHWGLARLIHTSWRANRSGWFILGY